MPRLYVLLVGLNDFTKCYFLLSPYLFTTTDGCELSYYNNNETGGQCILLHLELCIFETLKCKDILKIHVKDYNLSAHQGL